MSSRSPLAVRVRRALSAATVVTLIAGGASACSRSEDPRASKASAHPAKPLTARDRAVAQARTLVSDMTLAERAGQVLVPAWPGGRPPVAEMRRLHLGGIIALPGSSMAPAEAKRANVAITRAFRTRGYPAFLSVDQEGGSVSRLRSPLTQQPDFMAAGAVDSPALTRKVGRATGAELRSLGFTVVFAPDADVTTGPEDPAIGTRSASSNPAAVATQVIAAARGIASTGVVPVLKHFPGHGSVTTDSHLATPVQRASVAALTKRDLVPFERAISAGLPAVMTGHIKVPAVDKREPGSTSHAVTTDLLRRGLGFKGMVVTDALNMQGVQKLHRGPAAAVAALRAGADVVLMPVDTAGSRTAIVRAVRSGSLSSKRLADAATSMVATLLEARTRRTTAPLGSARPVVRQLVRRAVTSVAGPCRGRVLPDRIRVIGSTGATATFVRLASAQGVTVVPDTHVRVKAGKKVDRVRVRVKVDGKVVKRWKRKVTQLYRWVTRPADAPTVAVVDDGAMSGSVDVAVAVGRPYWLGRVEARVKIATFGAGEASQAAGLRVLLGRATAPGRLPVKVAGLSRTHC